jgi:hypothetical protein
MHNLNQLAMGNWQITFAIPLPLINQTFPVIYLFIAFCLLPIGFTPRRHYKMKKGCSNLQPSQYRFQIFFIVLFYDQLIGKHRFFTIT